MKDLTRMYSDLLQDRRIKAEQARYETFSRQRSAVLAKYRKVYTTFNDLVEGLMRAQSFYAEMGDTIDSLHKNVEAFVSNRRSEGAQLLGEIEQARRSIPQAEDERDRMRELMGRMSIEHRLSTPVASPPAASSRLGPASSRLSDMYTHLPTVSHPSQQNQMPSPQHQTSMQYQRSPLPEGYRPPPPPPGPPPPDEFTYGRHTHASLDTYRPQDQQQPRDGTANSADPWTSLHSWK